MELETIYKPIKNELAETEARIKRALINSDIFFSAPGEHLLRAKGKRLRPALVLLCAKLGKRNSEKAVDLAAALELIHTATLVHDDIIDNAKVRRKLPSLGVKFGLDTSILFGDFLFSKAFEIVSDLKIGSISSVLLRTTSAICQGEIRQLARAARPLEEKEYFQIIAKKTASLFSVCCETGGVLGGLGGEKTKELKTYGRNLGLGFQIADDCLDLVGDEKTAGKSLRLDKKTGKMTLPLIYLHRWPGKTQDEVINYSRMTAVKFEKRALAALGTFAESEAKASLKNIVEYIFASINGTRRSARC